MIMTDREALSKAQNELDTSSYLAEVTLNKGLQKVHQNRSAWLARVLRLARKALYIEENQKQPITIADRIRATDDVELMNRIYELYVLLSEFGHYELAEQFCDGKAECAGGEDCNEDRLKACILRWLQRPAEDTP
jgi:hypothetical protein